MQRYHCLCFTDHEAVPRRLLVNLSRSETLRSALCLTLQRKLRCSGWVGLVRFSSQMSHQQWVQLHFACPTPCFLGVHLIGRNSISFHKSRPFHNSALKFLVDTSLDNMKSLLKSLGFVIQSDFVFHILN